MRWDEMSMSQKSEAIGLMVRNGVTDIGTMKQMWDDMDGRKSPQQPPFAKRFEENPPRTIPTSQGNATHFMAADEAKGRYFAYPTVQPIDYKDDRSPLKYYGDMALDRALENNDVMEFPTLEDAIRYSENYKRPPSTGAYLNNEFHPLYSPYDYVRTFAEGGSIDDPPYRRYYATPQYGFSPTTSQTNVYQPIITDVQRDVAQGKPIGTTTAKREIRAAQQKQQETIQNPVFSREVQDEVNRATNLRSILEPFNTALDIAEWTPVLGDAISVGRSTADIVNGNTGIGLAGLGLTFLPNIFEKPLKKIGKGVTKTFRETDNISPIDNNSNLDYLRDIIMNISSDEIEENFTERMKTALSNWNYVEPFKSSYIYNKQVADQALEEIRKKNPKATNQELKELFAAEYGNSYEDILEANGFVWRDDLGNIKAASYNGSGSKQKAALTKTHEKNHTGFYYQEDSYLDDSMTKYIDEFTGSGKAYPNEVAGFKAPDFNNPIVDKETEGYMDVEEISSYASELLSLLGKRTQNLTGDELRWLNKNQELIARITGNGREYRTLFGRIIDFDKAANWINKHSTIIAAPLVGSSLILNSYLGNNEMANGGKLDDPPDKKPAIPVGGYLPDYYPSQQEWLRNWFGNREEQINDNFKGIALGVNGYDPSRSIPVQYVERAIDGSMKVPVKYQSIFNDPDNPTSAYNRETGQIFIDPNMQDIESTLLHERTHALNHQLPQRVVGQQGYEMSPIESKVRDVMMPWYKENEQDLDEYWDDPVEIYARMMQMRYRLNLDPKKKVTKEDLKKWRKDGLLRQYEMGVYDDDTLLQLFNEVADNRQLQNNQQNTYVIPTDIGLGYV